MSVIKHVVLIGLGHAHLHVVSKAASIQAAGLDVILVDDGAFWYSGSAAGLLSGRIPPEDDRVDSAELARAMGVTFIKARARQIDRERRAIMLDDGTEVPYDLLSLNTGSEVRPPFPVAFGDHVFLTKPVPRLLALRSALEAQFAQGRVPRVIVVGARSSGTELMFNLLALAERCGGKIEPVLVSSDSEVLMQARPGARRLLTRLLRDAGVRLVLNARVERLKGDRLHLEGGETLAFDYTLLAPGLWASPLVSQMGLPHDDKDGLLVTPCLTSTGDDRVFAAGDCASIEGHWRPKLGVFGVRSAPVLTENLLRRARGEALVQYIPQRKWFGAMSLGDGTGLGMRGRIWWRGRSALWLKEYFDSSFMKRYQRLARKGTSLGH